MDASTGSVSDASVLDAYSRAVVTAVDEVGPAVVSLATGRRGRFGGGAGSGVVVAPDGYVLTNAHVVEGASSIEVTFVDGRALAAQVVGADRASDLAIVRVSATSLPHVRTAGPAALRQGQLVVAIGNPFGFQSTVSTGVVSATGRALRGRDGRLVENLVQHTAPLNPGNSGGPLVDFRGRLVGVNTAIIAFAQGLSFAIPTDTVDWIVPKLLAEGRVRRAFLGVQGQSRPLEVRLLRALSLEGRGGVELLGVEPGTPAEAAGLRVGDVVIAAGDTRIEGIDGLLRLLAKWTPGEPMKLRLVRAGKLEERTATPGEAKA